MAAAIEEIEYEGLDHQGIAINMLAGAMAGISEHAVMYPVDSIKVSSYPTWDSVGLTCQITTLFVSSDSNASFK